MKNRKPRRNRVCNGSYGATDEQKAIANDDIATRRGVAALISSPWRRLQSICTHPKVGSFDKNLRDNNLIGFHPLHQLHLRIARHKNVAFLHFDEQGSQDLTHFDAPRVGFAQHAQCSDVNHHFATLNFSIILKNKVKQ